MNIIEVTPLVKRRTKDMLNDLAPEYGYVRITNQGLVILKKNFWSLSKTTINITDLYIDFIPKRLAESCKKKGYGHTYNEIFSNDIYVMLQLRPYKKKVSIVDYLWEKYNLLHREVPMILITKSDVAMEDPSKRYLPVISPVSTYYIPGVETLLNRIQKKDPAETLLGKIKKIQRRMPPCLVRTVELRIA